MAPKGRKSLSNNWCTCDSCGVTLSQKDVPQHIDSCPPDENNWQHPFIKDCTLFSFLEQSDIDGKHLSSFLLFSLFNVWKKYCYIEFLVKIYGGFKNPPYSKKKWFSVIPVCLSV